MGDPILSQQEARDKGGRNEAYDVATCRPQQVGKSGSCPGKHLGAMSSATHPSVPNSRAMPSRARTKGPTNTKKRGPLPRIPRGSTNRQQDKLHSLGHCAAPNASPGASHPTAAPPNQPATSHGLHLHVVTKSWSHLSSSTPTFACVSTPGAAMVNINRHLPTRTLLGLPHAVIGANPP